MFLDYLALFILLMGLTLVFYTFIYIHEIPHKIAIKNNHPHEEAIGVAGWLSLFTLHAIWPIVFIWAVMYNRGSSTPPILPSGTPSDETNRRIAELEDRLRKLENNK
jgi:hypothetical protein